MGDEKKPELAALLAEVVRKGGVYEDGKGFLVVTRFDDGWRFVVPSSMTNDEVSAAIDEAFAHPPLRISERPRH
jgi:hypothetical protein